MGDGRARSFAGGGQTTRRGPTTAPQAASARPGLAPHVEGHGCWPAVDARACHQRDVESPMRRPRREAPLGVAGRPADAVRGPPPPLRRHVADPTESAADNVAHPALGLRTRPIASARGRPTATLTRLLRLEMRIFTLQTSRMGSRPDAGPAAGTREFARAGGESTRPPRGWANAAVLRYLASASGTDGWLADDRPEAGDGDAYLRERWPRLAESTASPRSFAGAGRDQRAKAPARHLSPGPGVGSRRNPTDREKPRLLVAPRTPLSRGTGDGEARQALAEVAVDPR